MATITVPTSTHRATISNNQTIAFGRHSIQGGRSKKRSRESPDSLLDVGARSSPPALAGPSKPPIQRLKQRIFLIAMSAK
ncbi:MAG: hypothetical protein ACHP7D_01560 [Lysobacterales bacterium]